MAYDSIDVELIFDDAAERFDKSLSSYQTELAGLRAGRANTHILDKVLVDYYGTPTPINQMANISVPEARVLMISVWDMSALKNVEKAIIDANVGLMPNNDGKVIRLIFPELTEERRKALTKDVRAMAENAKIAVRNIRRDTLDALKKLKKDSVITEDDLSKYEKDIEKTVAEKITAIDKAASEKEGEIMSV